MKIYFEIFILLLISCSGNHQQQENDIQQTNNQDKKNLAYIIDTNKETTIENKNLQFLIEKDSIFRKDSIFKILEERKIRLDHSFYRKTGNFDFPLYYGGSYINKDNLLFVNIVDSLDNIYTKSDIINRIGNKDFKIKKCSYSLKMLGDTLNQLNTVFNRNKYLLKENLKTSNFEINIENNVILILLEDSTMENIQEFKRNIMDSPLFHFSQKPILYLH